MTFTEALSWVTLGTVLAMFADTLIERHRKV